MSQTNNNPRTNTAVLQEAGYLLERSSPPPAEYIKTQSGWKLPPCDCAECQPCQ